MDGEALPRLADLLGRFPTVHFSVEDVASLNGAPAGRRRFLDVALCQLEPAYVGHLRDYMAALKQRNRLLAEQGEVDDRELSAWEEILARSGAELDRRRGELTAELDRVLRELAEGLDPTLAAGVGVCGDGGERAGRGGRRRSAHGAARVARKRDRRLGWTTAGPASRGRGLPDRRARSWSTAPRAASRGSTRSCFASRSRGCSTRGWKSRRWSSSTTPSRSWIRGGSGGCSSWCRRRARRW